MKKFHDKLDKLKNLIVHPIRSGNSNTSGPKGSPGKTNQYWLPKLGTELAAASPLGERIDAALGELAQEEGGGQ